MTGTCSVATLTTEAVCTATLGATWSPASWEAGVWSGAAWTSATWEAAVWTGGLATWNANADNAWNTYTFAFVDRILDDGDQCGTDGCGGFPVRARAGYCVEAENTITCGYNADGDPLSRDCVGADGTDCAENTCNGGKDSCLAAGGRWIPAEHIASDPLHPATQVEPSATVSGLVGNPYGWQDVAADDPANQPAVTLGTYNSVLVTVKDAYGNPEFCVIDVEVWDNVNPSI